MLAQAASDVRLRSRCSAQGVFHGAEPFANKKLGSSDAAKRGEVPSGQAVLSEMLAECYELVEKINARGEEGAQGTAGAGAQKSTTTTTAGGGGGGAVAVAAQ